MHQFLDKKQIIRRKKITKNIIGFGIFFIFIFLGIISLIGQFSNYIGRPIWAVQKSITSGFENIAYVFESKGKLSEDNQKLIEENVNMKLSMIDYQILKNENNQLKEILGNIPNKNDFILGNILTKPNHSPYDTVIIDIGEKNGIKEGNIVYVNGNLPIGRIGKVYNNTSLIYLYTSPGQKTLGFMDGSNASVELTGRGGGNFEMIIPIELDAINGGIVSYPGNASEVIALIDEVISKPSDPFKKVILHSPINVQNLKWVEVKKN
jgi:cell shape-determining protein MreC